MLSLVLVLEHADVGDNRFLVLIYLYVEPLEVIYQLTHF